MGVCAKERKGVTVTCMKDVGAGGRRLCWKFEYITPTITPSFSIENMQPQG